MSVRYQYQPPLPNYNDGSNNQNLQLSDFQTPGDRHSTMPGLAVGEYGRKESMIALAIADAGGVSGGGGSGLTPAQAQAAFTAALQSQSQIEFQDTLLEDSTGTLFFRTKSIDEETGAITTTNTLPSGLAYTPVGAITISGKADLSSISANTASQKDSGTFYRAISNGTGYSIDDYLLQYKSISSAGVVTSRWYNVSNNNSLVTPNPTIPGNLLSWNYLVENALRQIEVSTLDTRVNLGQQTDPLITSGQDGTITSRLRGIESSIEDILTSTVENRLNSQGFYNGAATGNSTNEIIFEIDTQFTQGVRFTHVLFTSDVSEDAYIQESVDGTNWFSSSDFVTDSFGGLAGNASLFSLTGLPNYDAYRITARYVRLVTVGSTFPANFTYRLVNFGDNPIELQQLQDIKGLLSNLVNLNNGAQFPSKQVRLAKAIVSSSGVAVGDVLEFSFQSNYITPGLSTFANWNNLTQKTNNITAPALANIVWLDEIQEGQNNPLRLVNSTSASNLVKATSSVIKSFYIDNLGASIIYVQLITSIAAPVTGAIPVESYRCPANGSISIDLGQGGRVFSGSTFVAFSTTPGTFTASANAKNFILKFN